MLPADALAPVFPFLEQLERLTVHDWVSVAIAFEDALMTPAFRLARTRLKALVRAELGEEGRDALIARVRRMTEPAAAQVRLAYAALPPDALEVLEYGALIGAGVWLMRDQLTPEERRALYGPWALRVPLALPGAEA
jgi:hypothetical protein